MESHVRECHSKRTVSKTIRDKLSALLLCLVITVAFSSAISANPVGGQVAAGQATISTPHPDTTVIHQTTDKAIINWHSYNIGAKQTTQYQQPSRHSISLNRIDPRQGASMIHGRLTANGHVWLLNPAGIVFGADAVVDVGGILASTADITDENFMAGRYQFDQAPEWNGAIINNGLITVADEGIAVLVAPGVENNGVIKANLGKVALGAGTHFTLDFYGDELIHFGVGSEVTKAAVDSEGRTLKDAVSNKGKIIAAGGKVLIAARTAKNVLDHSINMSGIVEAKSAVSRNGSIILMGGDNGVVRVSGKMDASGKQVAQRGGSVKVLGKKVAIVDNSYIDVSGDQGGGEILIGGNAHGAGPEPNADYTYIGKETTLNADALTNGHGGKIIAWGNEGTQFYGSIFARGGSQGGNGGFVEVSGSQLDFAGNVDATAPLGTAGMLLLDPKFIIIQTSGGSSYVNNTNNLFANDPSNNMPTILTPASLASAAANIILQANTDVTFADNVALTSGGKTLTVNAGRSIIINSGVSVSTANGVISLTANDTNSGSATTSANRDAGVANITMGSGSSLSAGTQAVTLTINASTTSNGVAFDAGDMTLYGVTFGANSTWTAPNSVNINGAIVNAGNLVINANTSAGSGNVTFNSGGSITASNKAVTINVNTNVASGGTGSIFLNNTSGTNISTGGGALILRTIGAAPPIVNTTGGSITQSSSNTTINTAGGNITLQVPTSGSSSVGTNAQNIITTSAGPTLTLSAGSGGAFVNNAGAVTIANPLLNANSSFSVISSGALTMPNFAFNTGTGSLTFQSNGGTALNIANTLTTSSGNITLSATGLLTVDEIITTTGGNLSMTGNGITNGGANNVISSVGGGNITMDAGVTGLTMTAGSQFRSTGTVNISTDAIALNATSQIGGSGTGTAASSVTIQPKTAGTVINIGTGTAGLALTTTEADRIQATNVQIGNSTAGTMTITAWTPGSTAGSVFASNGAITLQTNSGGITQSGAINLGTSLSSLTMTTTGTLSTNAITTTNKTVSLTGGTLTQGATSITTGTGNITATADNMTLGGTMNASSGIVTLQPLTAGQLVNLGGADAAGTLGLTNTELNTITAGTLRVGASNSGALSVTAAISSPASVLSLISGSTISQSSASNTITATNLRLSSVGAVTLNTGNNPVSTLSAAVSGSANAFNFKSSGALSIGTVDGVTGVSTTNGNVLVSTNDGNLTVSQAVNAGSGTVSLTTAGGATNTLNVNAAVVGISSVTYSADHMALTGSTAGTIITLQPVTPSQLINLGGADASGTLGLTNAELDTISADILRIGASNSGALSVTAAISPAVSDALSLISGSTISQSSSSNTITAASLRLSSVGAVTLAAGNNPVNTLSAAVSGSTNAFNFKSSGTLSIGTVDGVTGVSTTNGNALISTNTGNLTVSQAVNAGSGTVSLTAGGANRVLNVGSTVTGTSGVTYTADNMTLTGSTNAGSAIATLQPVSASQLINLGGADASGTLGLTDAELDTITAGTLRVGASNSGALSVTAAISPLAASTLSLISGDTISQSSSSNTITATNLRLSSVGGVTLNTGNNAVGTLAASISGTGNAFNFSNTSALTVGTVDGVTGVSAGGNNITITTNNGNLTISQVVYAGSDAVSLTAGGGNKILNIGSTVTGLNGVTYSADNMALTGSTNAGSAIATLQPVSASQLINLGGADASGTLGLADAELDTITAGALRIGASNSGAMSVTAAISPLAASTLSLISGSTISQSTSADTITVTNLRLSSVGAVTLNTGNNPVNTLAASVSGSGNAFNFKSSGVLSTGTVDGVTNVSTTNGNVLISTNNGNLTASVNAGSGTVSLTAGGTDKLLTVSSVIGTSGVTYTADNMSLGGGTNGGALVILQPVTAGQLINLGGLDAAGTLGLTNTELNTITAGAGILRVGNSSSGAISVTAAISSPLTSLSLISGSTISQDNSMVITAGSLKLSSVGAVTLNAANNVVNTLAGSVSGSGSAFNFKSSGVLSVGTVDSTTGVSTTNGNVLISTNNGGLTVSQAVNGGSGTVSLSVGGANNTLTVSNTVTGTSGITYSADRMSLGSSTNAGSAIATLQPVTASQLINLGGADASGTLGLTDAELDTITAGTLRIGASNSGALSVTAAISPLAASTLSLISGSTISQSGSSNTITATNLRLSSVGAVTLDVGSNPVSTLAAAVSGSGNAFNFKSSGALSIGTVDGVTGVSTTNGAVSLTAGGADTTLTIGNTVTGTSVTYTADKMTLTGSTNAGSAIATLQPLTAGQTIELGSADATGRLGLTDAELDTITSGTLRVGASNSGALSVTAAISPLASTLSLISGSTISQNTSADTITATNLRLSNAGSGAVTLNVGNNAVGTLAAAISGGAFSFKSSGALNVGTVDGVSGITTNGGIISLSTNSNGITVSQAINSGTGVVTLTSSGTNTLNSTITGGAITLAGQVFVNNAGSSALNPSSGNRFLVYSVDPANDTRGGLVYGFKQYNITYPTAPTPGATGNGFLYSIAPSITPVLSGSVSKQYNATTTAPVTNANYATSTGIIDGDTVTFAQTSANYNDKNFGIDNKTVSVSGISISATDGGATVYGYQLASTTATADNIGTITKAPLTVNSDLGQTKVYGADDPSSAATAYFISSGILYGTDTLTGSMGRVAGETVGSYNFTQSSVNVSDGNGGANYAITFNGSTDPFQITTAPLTGSIANQIKTYGANDPDLSSISVTLGGQINRNVTDINGNVTVINDTSAAKVAATLSSLARDTGESVGSYDVSAAGFNVTGTSSSNYGTPNLVAGSMLTINKADLTGSIANQNKTYGSNDPSIGGIGVTLGGVINNSNIITWNGSVSINDTSNVSASLASLTRAVGESVSGSPYVISAATFTLGGSAAGNYNLPTLSGSPTLTINKASVTGSIANQSKTYGSDDPSLSDISVTLGGVINSSVTTWNGPVSINDTANVSASLASLTRAVGESVSGSPYAISAATFTLGGSASGNYNLPAFSGSPALTISKKNLTGSIANQSKTYGSDDPSLGGISVTLGGVINSNITTWNGPVSINDTGNVSTSLTSLTRTAGELVNGSPYAISAAGFSALTGSAAGNYNAPTLTGSPTLTINQANLTASIANQSKIYGTNDPAVSGIAVVLGNIINRNVTNWMGNVTPINDTGNVNASLGSLTRVAGETVSGGPYAVTGATFSALTGSAASNYSNVAGGLTGNPVLTITPANLTASIANQTKVYGTSDPSISSIPVLLGGVVNGNINTWNGIVNVNDTGNVSTSLASLTRTAGETVLGGPYPYTAATFNALSGSAVSNYNAPGGLASGSSLTITPAMLSAALSGTVSKVYDATTTATLSAANYQLTGVLGSDTVILNNPSTGSYGDKNVGTSKSINVAGLTISGASSSNYQLVSISINGNIGIITPASLATSGIIANSKRFNGNAAATLNTANAIFSGLLSADQGLVELVNPGRGVFANVGPGKNIPVTVTSLTLTGSEADNYTLVSPTNLVADILPVSSQNENVETTLTPFIAQVSFPAYSNNANDNTVFNSLIGLTSGSSSTFSVDIQNKLHANQCQVLLPGVVVCE